VTVEALDRRCSGEIDTPFLSLWQGCRHGFPGI